MALLDPPFSRAVRAKGSLKVWIERCKNILTRHWIPIFTTMFVVQIKRGFTARYVGEQLHVKCIHFFEIKKLGSEKRATIQ
jgi:hypothetical protein